MRDEQKTDKAFENVLVDRVRLRLICDECFVCRTVIHTFIPLVSSFVRTFTCELRTRRVSELRLESLANRVHVQTSDSFRTRK